MQFCILYLFEFFEYNIVTVACFIVSKTFYVCVLVEVSLYRLLGTVCYYVQYPYCIHCAALGLRESTRHRKVSLETWIAHDRVSRKLRYGIERGRRTTFLGFLARGILPWEFC